MGDPDQVRVPVQDLLSSSWIARRRVSIGEEAQPGVPAWAPAREDGDTTHVSVLDSSGNAVSLTTTLNESFGSGILVRGAGFLLNNEMDDFALAPGQPNLFGLVGGSANAPAAGKRPLSSMTPAVVRRGGHATTMVLGSPGGPKIITAVFQVLLRTLFLEQPIDVAVRAPRLHQQWNPIWTSFEPGWDPAIVAALETRRGHAVRFVKDIQDLFGSVQAIWLAEPGAQPVAVSDPRRGGSAAVQEKAVRPRESSP
jgi:gamma-glutamyltranspeptidase/glutathione hydrolase